MVVMLLIENYKFLNIQFVDLTEYSVFQWQRQIATVSGNHKLED